jgi:hypothetical protein
MREKPIIFSTPMVQAIREGRKTQTRRVIKPQPLDGAKYKGIVCENKQMVAKFSFENIPIKYGYHVLPFIPGDILWVRETWYESNGDGLLKGLYYKANPEDAECVNAHPKNNWRHSIFMPREAARIFLEVKSVRVERLQDIGEENAKAEGVQPEEDIKIAYLSPHREAFHRLWDSLNAKRGYGWDSMPWGWVMEFVRIKI